MPTYIYKSKGSVAACIGNYVVTVSPGLRSDRPIDLLDEQIGIALDRYTDGVLDTADDSSPALLKVNPLTGEIAGLASPDGGTTPLMGLLSFIADDTGTSWASCPKLLDLTATLASGTSTTVLVEVRNSAGVVSTAATITADTVSQTLRQTFTSRGNQDFRVRRSSGTGSVTITL